MLIAQHMRLPMREQDGVWVVDEKQANEMIQAGVQRDLYYVEGKIAQERQERLERQEAMAKYGYDDEAWLGPADTSDEDDMEDSFAGPHP